MNNLVLVPIPQGALDRMQSHWLPFMDGVARRSRSPKHELIAKLYSGEVIAHLAYEPETQKVHALAGSQVTRYGDQRVGEIVWCTGSGRKHWFPLIAQIEQFHKEHLACTAMKAICRPGWVRDLKQHGYRVSHLILEKDF